MSLTTRPWNAQQSAQIRQLTEALSGLEEVLQDRQRAERAQKLTEAAARSRQAARGALRRLQEVDGTDEAAHASTVERIHELL